MDKLTSMKVFAYVVEHGSFRNAAHHFDISPTMVGKHVSFLEQSLGTQLIHRTTRKQSLTEAGRLYYQECHRIIEDITNAENLIQTLINRPTGTVKVNCPVTYGKKVIAPIVADFLAEFPDLNVELMLDNNLIDPYRSEADVIIRIGELVDSSLVARKLGEYHMTYCASPSYLEQHAPIQSLDDLEHHHCLGFQYHQGESQQVVNMPSNTFGNSNTRLTSNNGDVLKFAALKGSGVLLQPKILVEQEIQSGALVEILQQHAPKPKSIHLLYRSKQLSLKNRTLVDFILSHVNP
ncbi:MULTISPECIES: LysR family transcriptional regulator [Vibrio]|uniref:LysR family transcriptional regulator n=1 Tax=Vibrio TaxID=662 RepID=UPI0013037252|nr:MULTISPECIES: LysR family transcriptional regulator [Vibrio]MCS0124547.1 LysR family transcriptional regulator [Vibrio alginolyticus]MCS0183105.1 LysR family transcriptional regulator [Vibrio alginolyticus]MDW3153710.1 LysR family transcriptional regulator [Vibrio sp. 779(2023)]ULF79344.1 LysR family transcriptional regulator [Vibrio alginolyticus]